MQLSISKISSGILLKSSITWYDETIKSVITESQSIRACRSILLVFIDFSSKILRKMATSLTWRALELSNWYYRMVLPYPHLVVIDVTEKHTSLRSRGLRLFPFYLSFLSSSVPVILSVVAGAKMMQGSSSISLHIFVLTAALGAIGFLANGLKFVGHRHGHELFSLYFNALVEFEKSLRPKVPDNATRHRSIVTGI